MRFGAAALRLSLQAFALLSLLRASGQRAEGAASPDEVQIEVAYAPKECPQKSKKGDLLNAHYDGYLASDKSKFYCRCVGDGHSSFLSPFPPTSPAPHSPLLGLHLRLTHFWPLTGDGGLG